MRSPDLPVRRPRRDAPGPAPASGVSRPSGRAPPDGGRGSLSLRRPLDVGGFVLVFVFGVPVVGWVLDGAIVSGDVVVGIVLGVVVATLFLLFLFFFLFFFFFFFFIFFFFFFFLFSFSRFAFVVLWRDFCGGIAPSLDAASTASGATDGGGSPTSGVSGGGSRRP